MTALRHIVEPMGLLLAWQPADEQAPNRTRRVVASISKGPDGQAIFRYLANSPDYKEAQKAGFQGHPAFDVKEPEVSSGVLEAFMRRLPPRKREDFGDFLALHRLPSPFPFSDMALLGYTGARLPSDGFSLVPIFERGVAPCDYILEVAGFRHEQALSTADLTLGDAVSFIEEPANQIDPGAIAIHHDGKRIGYVNRTLKDTFKTWLVERHVTGHIERINGKPERPLVFVRVEISC